MPVRLVLVGGRFLSLSSCAVALTLDMTHDAAGLSNLSFVGRCLFEVIDDEYLNRDSTPFQLESELL